MRHLVIRLVVALATFTVGTSATALVTSFVYPSGSQVSTATVSRLADEAEITRIVFRRQIEQDSDLEGHTLYLSCYNYSDPPTSVMSYLVENGLPAEPLSQINYDSFPPQQVGRRFLRVGSIKWISDNEVVLGGSVRGDGWGSNTRAYIYHLVRVDDEWKIISTETIS